MKLTELLTSPWAILPESLCEIQQIYTTHLKGEKIDVAAVEARLGRPLANEQQRYTVRDGGVAVLSVEGVIAPKANLFTQISGGVSAQMLVQQINSLAADSRVKSVIPVIDSPGGSVFGTPEASKALSELASVKPVVSLSDASMASAAYWFGAAANAVYITGPTVNVGSIGVYARMGLSQGDPSSIEMVRGKYKRGGINGEKPSAEYMAYVEAQLDHLYSVFVDTVAAYRGVSTEEVLERMADGRVFIGQQALDAGLVDGIATLDELAERMATNPAQFSTRRKAVFALGTPALSSAGAQSQGTDPEPVLLDPPATATQEGTTMDLKTLAEQHPDLLANIQAEARAAGAKAEQERVAAVRAQSMPGHEALIEKLAADGKTTGPEAAMAVLAAERAAVQARGQAMVEGDAPKPVATGAAPSDKPKTKTEQVAEAKAYAAEHQVDFITAMKKLGFA